MTTTGHRNEEDVELTAYIEKLKRERGGNVTIKEIDISAGRWCEVCYQYGSHHTDMHGDFVKNTLIPLVKEVIRDSLSGDIDYDEHAFVTCSDDMSPNFLFGCPRCIMLKFAK